jgi:hypothetical protein
MATARICDWCGGVFLPQNETANSKKNNRATDKTEGLLRISDRDDDNRYLLKGDIIDLCPDCAAEFEKWLKNQPAGE